MLAHCTHQQGVAHRQPWRARFGGVGFDGGHSKTQQSLRVVLRVCYAGTQVAPSSKGTGNMASTTPRSHILSFEVLVAQNPSPGLAVPGRSMPLKHPCCKGLGVAPCALVCDTWRLMPSSQAGGEDYGRRTSDVKIVHASETFAEIVLSHRASDGRSGYHYCCF